MKTLSVLICAKNEQDFVKVCLEHLEPFVDEIIFVDNFSDDKTKEIASHFSKVKLFDFPPTKNMGAVRNFSLKQATGDWILQCDCDEIYPASEMEKIREFIETTDAISFRVHYKNLSWRSGYAQKDFGHYPDRSYRRDVIDEYRGVLPVDMTYVKKEFLDFPNKSKGDIGPLEYDNADDKSFIHPRQPLLDVTYFHLARTRGHNFEYNKWINYNRNMHPEWNEKQLHEATRTNAWVNGIYEQEPVTVPEGIPTKTIPNPKVSVIVTCFNKSLWIEDCIDSILDQTYKPFEVIVVNDGSTDPSGMILSRRNDIIYIQQENQGVVRARNNGLDKATGDYFILIDGDDCLKPTYIERCLQEMKGNVQIVTTDFEGLGEWEKRIHRYPHPFNKEQLKTAQTFPSVMALCDMRLRSPYGNFQNFIFEDYAFWLELVFRRGANVVHIPEPLCYYRRTTGTRCDQADNEVARQQLREEFKEFGVNPL